MEFGVHRQVPPGQLVERRHESTTSAGFTDGVLEVWTCRAISLPCAIASCAGAARSGQCT
jgi:hypothetical protein